MYWFTSFYFCKSYISIYLFSCCHMTFRMELRCVIAVIRHGDRTPKQKMKMEVRHQRYRHFTSSLSLTCIHHSLPTKYEIQVTTKPLLYMSFLISHVVSFRFFDLFEKCEGYKSGKLKLKKPKQLQVKKLF